MAAFVQVGSACIDITPPLSMPYLGIWPRHQPFQQVHDPLCARAVVVQDGQTSVALLSVDGIGFSNKIFGPCDHFTAKVRRRITEQTGIPAGHIMLAATHAHSTPETLHLRRLLDTPGAERWLRELIDQLVDVTQQAVSRRQACVMKIGCTDITGVARNRRVVCTDGSLYQWGGDTPSADRVKDWGAVDSQATSLIFQRVAGEECVLLMHFTCHPVTMQAQPLMSSDYPGLLTATLERDIPGCHLALFLQGACGDINPVYMAGRYDDVERISHVLCSGIMPMTSDLLTTNTSMAPQPIVVRSAVIALPPGEIPDGDQAAHAYDMAQQALDTATSAEDATEAGYDLLHAEEQLTRYARRAEALDAEIQVIRFGEVILVGIPGEPFVEIGLEIKRRSPARWTVVVGYANGYLGYIPTPQAWKHGGYEVRPSSWSLVGPAAAPLVIETAMSLITEAMNATQ